jgi:hypothetical protein
MAKRRKRTMEGLIAIDGTDLDDGWLASLSGVPRTDI